jgi:hypothetical protein
VGVRRGEMENGWRHSLMGSVLVILVVAVEGASMRRGVLVRAWVGAGA